MITYLSYIYRKAGLIRWHELAAFHEESDELFSSHIISRACIETLISSELRYDSLDETLSRIAVTLHHVKDFVSVCHMCFYLIKGLFIPFKPLMDVCLIEESCTFSVVDLRLNFCIWSTHGLVKIVLFIEFLN